MIIYEVYSKYNPIYPFFFQTFSQLHYKLVTNFIPPLRKWRGLQIFYLNTITVKINFQNINVYGQFTSFQTSHFENSKISDKINFWKMSAHHMEVYCKSWEINKETQLKLNWLRKRHITLRIGVSSVKCFDTKFNIN